MSKKSDVLVCSYQYPARVGSCQLYFKIKCQAKKGFLYIKFYQNGNMHCEAEIEEHIRTYYCKRLIKLSNPSERTKPTRFELDVFNFFNKIFTRFIDYLELKCWFCCRTCLTLVNRKQSIISRSSRDVLTPQTSCARKSTDPLHLCFS